MLKILITGAGGYLGSNLRKHLKERGYDVYSISSKDLQDGKAYQMDITNVNELYNTINGIKPEVIIHTVALNSLSECEENPELAMKVNVKTTTSLIEILLKVNPNIKLVFMSSDYVFDGAKGNYKEDDKVNPQTIYGKTKTRSEDDIRTHLKNYIICRSANIYGRGGNFFNFILTALEENKTIDVLDSSFYTPTYIDYFLDSLTNLIETDYKGTIHIAGSERLSRYSFALIMAKVLGKDRKLVKPSKQTTTTNLIAKDSSLNCEQSRKILNNYWPTVDESLNYCFGNLVSPYFYFADNRGRLIGLFQEEKWEEINYIESSKGSIRGNHYHKVTREAFFIIEGEIRITLTNIKNNTKRTFTSKKGNILIVDPYILHTFEVLKDSKWINMLSKPLKGKTKDIHRDYQKS